MRTIGIVAHSYEGGALCFLTACREGAVRLGAHLHPTVALSAVPMGLSLAAWQSGDHQIVSRNLTRGVRMVAEAGADFYVCPDNTAHLVLEKIAADLPIPGLHIADVVCREIDHHDWRRVGLLGTRWTMTGPVYERALWKRGLQLLVPSEAAQQRLHNAIFGELCQGVFRDSTTGLFVAAISELESRGAECVILGCTEIPLIITPDNSPLPVLDSTRLLARYAVDAAIDESPLKAHQGWMTLKDF